MELRRGRGTLALHPIQQQPGPVLLLLHSLGSNSQQWGHEVRSWPGAAFALDFPGHGQSGWTRGGVYTPELLLADADAALEHLGEICVAGSGIGAYVALLLAGARSAQIPAALLVPGPGLAGGGVVPDFDDAWREDKPLPGTGEEANPVCDPRAASLQSDIRPLDYAEAFAQRARRLLLVEDDSPRPPWWEIVRKSPAAETASANLESALAALAR